MAYRFKRTDSSTGESVRRIADEQIRQALASIEARERAEAIHDVRKRCKKLRGLIRLVRPAFNGYSRENAAFRDAARLVSGARDAQVMQDTYDLLMKAFEDQVDRRALSTIRRTFTLQLNAEAEDGDLAQKLAKTRGCLLEAKERVCAWEIHKDGWKSVAGGLEKTYGRAKAAAKRARACPADGAFHELRKRIKYHWYHCRLLEDIWPGMMGFRKSAAKELSDILGDHHDLAVFAGNLRSNPSSFGDARDVEMTIGLARARQERLEEKAWPILDRMLAQPPEVLGEYLGALWEVWRKDI